MSKLNQIEKALSEIEGGKFQRIVDTYLFSLGYGNICSWGNTVGSDKTTSGTPDSYIQMDNGRFIFIECTTKQSNVFDKFNSDLDKCFDDSKTGVPIHRIQKIIICYNTKLSPNQLLKLAEKCKYNNSDFEYFDITSIAFGLLKFPHIAKDHLGIEIDTGQILLPQEFIKAKTTIPTTPLDNVFMFREEELKKIEESLEKSDLILLSGKPGAGKTKLAIEVISRYSQKYSDCQCYCIENKNLPIYEDLRAYFSDGMKYIVLVDDANRISQLPILLQLLENKNKDIKFILTVRDYAVSGITKILNHYPYELVEIQQFDRIEIRQILLSESFGIKNPILIKRICDIAKGNPRLAIMGAMLAIDNKERIKLNDASHIYDLFFRKLFNEVDQFQDKTLLKVLAIVSYFRIIDNRSPNFSNILKVFQVSEIDFWEKADALYELEIIDLFENKACKIVDQIQAIYFFYCIVIKDRILYFEDFLNNFYFAFVQTMKDCLIPIANTFDFQFVKNQLTRKVDVFWDANRYDEEKALLISDTFWPFRSTEVLHYIYEKVSQYNQELGSYQLEIGKNEDITDKYLSILRYYVHSTIAEFRLSLEIIVIYLKKRPVLLNEFISYIKQFVNSQFSNFQLGYSIQLEFFAFCIENSKHLKILEEVIFFVAPDFMKLRHERHYNEGKAFYSEQFVLEFNEDLKQIRSLILSFIFNSNNNEQILSFLENYYRFMGNDSSKETITFDALYIIPYFRKNLASHSYKDACLVHRYLFLLERLEVLTNEVHSLNEQFTNKTYELSKLLNPDRQSLIRMRKEQALTWDQIEATWEQELLKNFEKYKIDDYKSLIKQIYEMIQGDSSPRYVSNLQILLKLVLVKDNELFLQILSHIVETENHINLSLNPFMYHFFNQYPKKHNELFTILRQPNYQKRDFWLLDFFKFLPVENINHFYTNALLETLKGLTNSHTLNFDFLENFENEEPEIIVMTLRLLYEQRNKLQHDFYYLLYLKKIQFLIEKDLELFFEIYLYQMNRHNLHDDHNQILQILLQLDPKYIIRLLKNIHMSNSYVSGDQREYNFIWKMENYEEIFEKIIEFLITNDNNYITEYHLINVFFKPDQDEEIETIKVNFIGKFIKANSANLLKIKLIFIPIVNYYENKINDYCKIFISHNDDYESFKKIQFDFDWYSSNSSSLVPIYEARISFWESILPLFDSVRYMKHRLFVSKQINQHKKNIDEENYRNFIDQQYF